MPAVLLTGDVMIGRGIDQILRHPSSPELYEPFVRSATIYVELAEKRNGPIPRLVPDDYVWGDALDPLRSAPLTIINLETAATRAGAPAPKGHPLSLPPGQSAGSHRRRDRLLRARQQPSPRLGSGGPSRDAVDAGGGRP